MNFTNGTANDQKYPRTDPRYLRRNSDHPKSHTIRIIRLQSILCIDTGACYHEYTVTLVWNKLFCPESITTYSHTDPMDLQRTSASLMARPGVTFATLPQMNIPWIESPFFSALIPEQSYLTPEEKEYCIKYSRDGYFLIEDL